MMSSSNYSIGLQRLKPVHTAYCGLHSLAENWSWAREVNGRDRDETETLIIFLETRPRRAVGTSRDRLETETSRPRPQPCIIVITTWLGSPTRFCLSDLNKRFLTFLVFASLYFTHEVTKRSHSSSILTVH